MPVKELDLLVHPFFLSPSGRKSDPAAREELWKKRVDAISKRPHHYLAVVLGARGNHDALKVEELLRYATASLGKQRVILARDDGMMVKAVGSITSRVRKIGFDPKQVRMHAYGEYADSCVTASYVLLAPRLVAASRIANATRILPQYSTFAGVGIPSLKELKGNKYLKERIEIKEAKRELSLAKKKKV